MPAMTAAPSTSALRAAAPLLRDGLGRAGRVVGQQRRQRPRAAPPADCVEGFVGLP